jgi:hypothetical protein
MKNIPAEGGISKPGKLLWYLQEKRPNGKVC